MADREPPSVDTVLTDLEQALRGLGDQSAPLDRLVSDHERARGLLREAERRLERLGEEARRLQDRITPNRT